MFQELAQLHRDGRLDEAESGYRALLSSQPENVDVLHLLGVLRRQRNDRIEARLLLDRARVLAPTRTDILLELAGISLLEGDTVGSRVLLEQTVKLDPNQAGAYTLLAQVTRLSGDDTRAESLYRTALRLSDEDTQALAGLGRLLMDRGDLQKSLSYLTRAGELSPRDPTIQLALARALYLNGNPTFAEQAARNALSLAPELHPARHLLGQILIETQRIEEGEAVLSVLAEAPGQRAIAAFGLADAARASGRLELAVERYGRALALEPAQPRAVHSMAWCLGAMGRDADALKVYHDYLANYPESLPVMAGLADHHMAMGRHAEALAIWSRIAQKQPTDPFPRLRMALLCERLGDNANAQALASQITSVFPKDVELILLRARAAYRDGDAAAALSLLNGLHELSLQPGQAMQAAHLYGVVSDSRGDTATAVRAWIDAQASAPTAVHALEAVPDDLAAALARPVARADAAGPRRVFLVGLPGSMVERVAALLSEQPGVQVLRDRAFGVSPRADDFAAPTFDRYLAGLAPEAVAEIRARYSQELERLVQDPAATVTVDWLLRWDARFLPLLREAFPDATLIVVDRAPQDLLINWLAYGWMPGFPVIEPLMSARWLATATAHLAAARSIDGLQVERVDADAILADPATAGASLARVLGRDGLVAGSAHRGLGGLPLGLPAGRWKAYEQDLHAAFNALAAATS
ncbi:tetratricopeptide repeat protein [Tahibacter amnicola]|uniref:Tetratricopeptide repeat protein n=1 Tax=Tahibacter amnicola TaxID=2976241 RepID=A0ABY6BKI7_9GAMM|nr:tetratricopeptide repeat protein [Tahibacter amnicola]UXI68307.1 tetratricopeptide repeat protein [Tahibacter amnicola]